MWGYYRLNCHDPGQGFDMNGRLSNMFSDKANLIGWRHWLARLHVLAVGCITAQPDRMSQRALGPSAHSLWQPGRRMLGRTSCRQKFFWQVARRTAVKVYSVAWARQWPCGDGPEGGFSCPERMLTAARYTTSTQAFRRGPIRGQHVVADSHNTGGFSCAAMRCEGQRA
jgi:hypothetical protein